MRRAVLSLPVWLLSGIKSENEKEITYKTAKPPSKIPDFSTVGTESQDEADAAAGQGTEQKMKKWLLPMR